MTETNNRSGMFVGMNHGHIANAAKRVWKNRPVTRKGRTSRRAIAVREIIREVAGFSPLEKKMLEAFKTDDPSKEKRAVKHARAKLGTHKRAQHKKHELMELINAQKRQK